MASRSAKGAVANIGKKAPSGMSGQSRLGKTSIFLAIAVFLVGVALIAYPLVSNVMNQSREHGVVESTADTISGLNEETLVSERERALEYNRQLLDGRAVVTDPFDPDAERPTDEDYNAVLNLAGDGVMGTLNIPAIHLELPIYHTVDSSVLEHGVGHLEGTSLPIGGESSHCVLSGHTGLPRMKIFDNLDQLEVGDYFIISVLGEDHAYQVTSTEVVLPDETDSLVIQEGKDLCTLVTCTPYGVNTHRLLVHAERCEVPEEWLNKGDTTFPAGYSDPPDKALLPSVLIGLLLAALIIGGYALWSRWRHAHRGGWSSTPRGRGPQGLAPRAASRRATPSHAGSPNRAMPANVPSSHGGGTAGVRPVMPITPQHGGHSTQPRHSPVNRQVQPRRQQPGQQSRAQCPQPGWQSQAKRPRTHLRVVDGGISSLGRHARRGDTPKDGTRTRGLHFRDQDR